MIKPFAAVVLLLALGGCATLNSLDSDVTTFSRWPAGRAPATYAFERLPSQQAQPQQAQMLEDAARRAVESAGFRPAAEGAAPDVGIQVGARITATERAPFDDPFWYGGFGPWRPYAFAGRHYRPYWGSPGWRYGYGGYGYGYGYGYEATYYEREVAVLIRDKRSGEPLYESRATSDGPSSATQRILPAMFVAAMQDFPNASTTPRRVRVDATAQAVTAK